MTIGKLWRVQASERVRAVGLAMLVVASILTLGVSAGVAQQASVVSVENASVSEGTDANLNVSVNTIPNGLQKYNLTISLSNPAVADIDTARMGAFGPFQIVAQSPDSITVRAVDLNQAAQSGSGPVRLTMLELTNTTEGTTDVVVTVNQMIDDSDTGFSPTTQAGTLTVTADGDGQPQPQANTTVTVSLDGAPNGLRSYNLTVTTTTSATITEVTPQTITGPQFQRLSGGVGQSSVTARAVDLSGTVDSFSGKRTLLNVTFDGDVQASDVRVTVHDLRDDNGAQISRDQLVTDVQVESPPQTPFPNGIPGVNTQTLPNDPDNDGVYEDVDGDGDVDFDDAIALSFAEFSTINAGSQAQIAALDFDDDGDVDFDDAIALAFI